MSKLLNPEIEKLKKQISNPVGGSHDGTGVKMQGNKGMSKHEWQ